MYFSQAKLVVKTKTVGDKNWVDENTQFHI